MRYSFPLLPGEFEIPDQWWAEAGMTGFVPVGRRAYCSAETAVLVPLRDVEPPFRLQECKLDGNGFDRLRLISILRGFVAATEIVPVPLIRLPSADFPPAPFGYRVRDGFHRFYASVAAGFECLPSIIEDRS
jgi:hypothetical protein